MKPILIYYQVAHLEFNIGYRLATVAEESSMFYAIGAIVWMIFITN